MGFTDVFTDTWNKIKDGVDAAARQAATTITTIGDKVAHGAQDALGTVENAANTAVSTVDDEAKKGLSTVTDAASKVEQTLVDAGNEVANNATQLAHWITLETAKAQLISAALLGLQKSAAVKAPQDTALQAIAKANDDGYTALVAVQTDWNKFIIAHAPTGDTQFGKITVQGMKITQFSMLRSKIATWNADNGDAIQPAITTANAKLDMPSMEALNDLLKTSCSDAADIAAWMVEYEKPMLDAGLKDHASDISSALSTLSGH